MPRRCFLTALGAALALAAPAASAPAQPAPTDEAVLALPEVTVTARHFEASPLALPASVSVLGPAELERAAGLSLPEALARAANVRFTSVTGAGAQAQVSLRGFGDNSGQRVLILVDGQKLNPPDLGAINWDLLPLGELERVEVVRGGQSVLYGHHALAGVVRVTTRRDGGGPRVSAEAADHGRMGAGAQLGGAAGRWWGRAGASAFADPGFRPGGAARGAGLALAAGHRGDAGDWSFRVAADAGRTELPGPMPYETFVADPDATLFPGRDVLEHRQAQATAFWEGRHAWGESQLNLGLRGQEIDWRLDGRDARNRQGSLTLAPRLRVGGDDGRALTAGLDLAADALAFTDYLDADRAVVRARADLTRLTAAAYALGEVEARPGLTLTAGGRYEWAGTAYDHRAWVEEQLRPVLETNRGPVPNPAFKDPPDLDPARSFDETLRQEGAAAEAAALWRARPDVSLWARWNRVYRYPALDETASYQGYPLDEPLNRDLRPETGDNLELGLTHVGRVLKVSATLFDLRLRDEIAFDAEARLNRNVGATRRRGGELSARAVLGQWTLATAWTALEARRADGATVPLVPSVHGASEVSLRLAGGWEVGAFHRWTAPQRQGNDEANTRRGLPAVHQFDLQAAWAGRGLRLTFTCANAADARFASTAYAGGYYPAPGRSFRAAFSATFPRRD